MNIFSKIINKTIDKRINNYTKGVGSEMKYNPLMVTMTSPYTDRHMTRRLLENGVLYSGIEQDIQYFYKVEAPKFYRKGRGSESLNYFWAKNDAEFRKIHSGLPQLISEKMVDLITGNGFNILVDGVNEKDLQVDLDNMLKENKFKSLLGKGIETESWSGGNSWKLSFNPNVSEYPIIEVWQPENYTNRIECGRIIEDIFLTYYEKNNTQYRLSEIYGVDREVGAYIDYKLEMLERDVRGQEEAEGKWIDVKLSTLEQTSKLKRVDFKGYFKRLSLYKPNKLPNSEFRYTILGESDYSGSYGAFDALDETISTLMQEFRDSKLNRYFPEEFMPTGGIDGNTSFPSDFKSKHVVYADTSSDTTEKQGIVYEQGDLRIDKHLKTYQMWLEQVLNNAGLSPMTIGITGLEAIDASAESQQEREKVSIRTRNKKIEIWKEFLQDILKTALEFHLMTKNLLIDNDGVFNVKQLPDFEIIATFEDYIIKSKKDRTEEVTAGFGKIYDVQKAIEYVHDDMTPEEQLELANRIDSRTASMNQNIDTHADSGK